MHTDALNEHNWLTTSFLWLTCQMGVYETRVQSVNVQKIPFLQ